MDTPFLLRGRSQPVRWEPWGPEAFERARREGRPVLLLVGASWCGACAHLDADAFDEPEVASLLNAAYVPVRVDRDLRPDVDARYQTPVSLISGQAGWPLVAFLDPADGNAFFGGMRFLKSPDSRPGFPEVLETTARYFRLHPDKVQAFIRRQLRSSAARPLRPFRDPAAAWAAPEGDAGGFGERPRFLLPGALDFLLSRNEAGDPEAGAALHGILASMIEGEIHDPLGGGFHRMSAGPGWALPRREKRLGENADLLRILARAHARRAEPAYLEAAADTAAFLETLRDPAGGFFAGVVGPVDRKPDPLYLWQPEELARLLSGPERSLLAAAAGWRLSSDGRFAGAARSLPPLRLDAAAARRLGLPRPEARRALAGILLKLRAAWRERPPRAVDPTWYTAANARAARGLLAVSALPGLSALAQAGEAALERLLAEGRDASGAVLRAIQADELPRLAEDQAQTGLACLDFHAATGQGEFLDAARALGQVLLERFWVAAAGAFRDVEAHAGLPPLHPVLDLPDPSANGLAALFLARLGRLPGPAGNPFLRAARGAAETLAGEAASLGPYAATLHLAAEVATRNVELGTRNS